MGLNIIMNLFCQIKSIEPSEKEKEGFIKLNRNLKKISNDIEAEDIQTKIYDIGMSLKFDNLKTGFQLLSSYSWSNQGPAWVLL